MHFRVAVKKEAKNARSSRTNKFRKTKQNARLKILLISSRAFSSYIKFGGFGRINFFIFSLPFGRFLMCQYSKTRRYLFSTTVFACSRRLIGGFILCFVELELAYFFFCLYLMIAFIKKQNSNTTMVNAPYTKMLVYQGADCIAYSSGRVLKFQTT